jgi:hypothetical protein
VLAPQDERPDEAQTDDPTIAFQTEVMVRLIPNLFLPRLESVGVDKTWLQEIATLCDSQGFLWKMSVPGTGLLMVCAERDLLLRSFGTD